jgi:hypothetical protein
MLGVIAAMIWGISALLGFEQFGLPTVVVGLGFAYSGSALSTLGAATRIAVAPACRHRRGRGNDRATGVSAHQWLHYFSRAIPALDVSAFMSNRTAGLASTERRLH